LLTTSSATLVQKRVHRKESKLHTRTMVATSESELRVENVPFEVEVFGKQVAKGNRLAERKRVYARLVCARGIKGTCGKDRRGGAILRVASGINAGREFCPTEWMKEELGRERFMRPNGTEYIPTWKHFVMVGKKTKGKVDALTLKAWCANGELEAHVEAKATGGASDGAATNDPQPFLASTVAHKRTTRANVFYGEVDDSDDEVGRECNAEKRRRCDDEEFTVDLINGEDDDADDDEVCTDEEYDDEGNDHQAVMRAVDVAAAPPLAIGDIEAALAPAPEVGSAAARLRQAKRQAREGDARRLGEAAAEAETVARAETELKDELLAKKRARMDCDTIVAEIEEMLVKNATECQEMLVKNATERQALTSKLAVATAEQNSALEAEDKAEAYVKEC